MALRVGSAASGFSVSSMYLKAPGLRPALEWVQQIVTKGFTFCTPFHFFLPSWEDAGNQMLNHTVRADVLWDPIVSPCRSLWGSGCKDACLPWQDRAWNAWE